MTRQEEKRALRATLRRIAEGLPESYPEKGRQHHRRPPAGHAGYQEAETVFCFVGTGWEIDTRPILSPP